MNQINIEDLHPGMTVQIKTLDELKSVMRPDFSLRRGGYLIDELFIPPEMFNILGTMCTFQRFYAGKSWFCIKEKNWILSPLMIKSIISAQKHKSPMELLLSKRRFS